MSKGNAVIGQSGGPTSVINQSLVGVVQELRKLGHVDQILGARHGVRGIVEDKYIKLNSAPDELLERIAATPAAALGSSRDKPDQVYCEKIFANFAKNNVRYFFYIGGNDSADTARIVSELAQQAKHDLTVFHIPKTIDNDLRVHDHTPGYGSAARYVAFATIGDDYDNKSLPGIKVNIIMGRNAGFLTAATALARKYETDGPHLIYVPEIPLAADHFLADVDRVYSKLGRCIVSMSEGASAPDGKTWSEKLNEKVEADMHGNIQLSGTGALGDFMSDFIKKNLKTAGGKKLRVRADTFGYPQRSFFGCVSETDAIEARTVGRKAAQYCSKSENNTGGSICMTRAAGSVYAVEYHLEPLQNVARLTKHMPAEFIQNGNDVTKAFIDYVTPLVGSIPNRGSLEELKG